MGKKKSSAKLKPSDYELAKAIEISVTPTDIVKHIKFLKKIDQNGLHTFYTEDFVRNAVRRYENFWIPLVLKLSDNYEDDFNYAPPLDVHWVWHVHMLAPLTYKRDLKRLFGRVINHKPKSTAILEATRPIWNEMFPDEPFDYPDEMKGSLHYHESNFDYDIWSAVQRQKLFFYQVSLPHYLDEAFLNVAILRYKMYLYLKSMYPNEFLVPCYDMDIVWHTHQVNPVKYEHETKAIVGHHLPHDDSVNDRAPGSKLCNSEEVTRKLWKETFNKEFSRNGSMFRGEPPNGRLKQLEFQDDFLKGDKFSVSFDKKIEWICDNPQYVEKCSRNCEVILRSKLHYYPLSKGGWDKKERHFKTSSKKIQSNSISFGLVNQSDFSFEENSKLTLSFEIEQKKMATDCFCLNYEKMKSLAGSANSISMDESFVNANEWTEKEFDLSHKLLGKHRTKLNISGSVQRLPEELVWKKFTIDPGTFYDCIMPEQVEALWGPIPLGRLPPGMDNECKAVTHR